MGVSAVEEVSVASKRAMRRRMFARNAPELGLVVLFILTAAIIAFQHPIFGRDIVVTDKTAGSYMFSDYADTVSGGKSTIQAAAQPLRWSCDLRAGLPTLFCGYEVLFDGNGTTRGVDLRSLDSLELTLDYHGPAPTVRVYLKNDDPRYSTHGDRSTDKVNKVEFSAHNGPQTVSFGAQDFSVADWWLSGKNFAPELGRTQLNNVVSLEVSTGTVSPPGHYSFRIKSLTMRRSGIPPSQLYLIIIVSWAVLVAIYMFIRLQRARHDALETEHAQAQARAALASAKQVAEQASEAKSDFLASMSHELRTPLNAVLGYAQLLERAPLNEKHLSAARTIRRSGNHLLSLITDILDLAKIEARKMELHLAPTDLRSAVASVVEMIGVRAEEKGLLFSCVIDEGVPEAIEADSKKLRQILLNLLSNAVKFTSVGRVSLRVTLLERDADSASIRFEVQDSGPGIAEADLDQIFRPFEQVGEIQRREGGTGLGLAISRQLATLMGSQIQVQSRVGLGTSFWFEPSFLVTAAPTAEAVADSSGIRGYAGPRRTVLVVDDHEANRELLCDLLQPIGFDTHIACDGREAVRMAQLTAPDLILMDLKMPVMGGVEAIRLMRLIEPLKLTPILAVSANNAEEGAAQVEAAGANGFLSKPIDNGELFAAIGRLLKLEWITATVAMADTARPVPEAEGSSVPAKQSAVDIGERSLRILAADDNATNQQILRTVLQGLDLELEIVSDGEEAIRAFQNHSFDLVLMDLRMPGMGGVEATRAIRLWEAQSRRPRTPIIALSAEDMNDRVAEYKAVGMDGHLDKPIEIEKLYRLLEAVSAGMFADDESAAVISA